MASDQALRDLILASNPVGYYPLDNPANLGNDLSPAANHGSQSGSFSQGVSSLAGMDFVMTRGVSSPLVAIPDRAEYRGRTFTVECLIALSEDANLVIMERGGDNKNWSLQSIGSAGGMTPPSIQNIVGDQAGGPQYGRAGPLLPFCHLIATSALGFTKVYMNGVTVKEWTTATGNGTQLNQGTLPIHLFSRGGSYATSAHLAHVAFYNRELSVAERQARAALLDLPYEFKTQPLTAIPANPETRAQFQPQDVAWRGGEGKGFAGPVSQQPISTVRPCQPGLDLFWTRDGVQAPAQGYIESTVTLSGEGVRRRVLCFDQAGNLVGETWSR